jgi:phosphatidylglycerophosphate synthase
VSALPLLPRTNLETRAAIAASLRDRPGRGQSARIVTAPNLLTLIRVPLAGVMFLAVGDALWLLSVAAVAAATDVVDGRVARALRRRQRRRGRSEAAIAADTALGAWLDPLCDKVFVIAALLAAAIGFEPPLAVLVLAATREILLAPMVLAYHLVPGARRDVDIDFSAGRLGKLTTAAQFATIAAILFAPALALATAILAAFAGILAALRYLHNGIAAARRGLGHRA